MTWADRTRPIKVGDVVAYSRPFLRSIGCYTGNLPRARGKVTSLAAIGEVKVAEIAWDLPDVPARVNVKNLVRVHSIECGVE